MLLPKFDVAFWRTFQSASHKSHEYHKPVHSRRFPFDRARLKLKTVMKAPPSAPAANQTQIAIARTFQFLSLFSVVNIIVGRSTANDRA